MKYSYLKKEHLHHIHKLWNQTYQAHFHIRNDLFESQIVNDQTLDYSLSEVVLKNNQLIGFILVKTSEKVPLDIYQNTVWISLMLVSETYQNQGVGKTLIKNLKNKLKNTEYTRVLLGKELHNFFPGVPSIFHSVDFFKKQGFDVQGVSYDLHRHVLNSNHIPLKRELDYNISVANEDDFESIRIFFEKNFPTRWLYEFNDYVKLGGKGKEFVIIQKENKVIAFARINGQTSIQNMYNRNWSNMYQNLFGVGPLGVDTDYRGYGLGYDIVAYAVNEAIKRKASDIIIDWTSKVEFYRKFGFEVWHDYTSCDLDLRG